MLTFFSYTEGIVRLYSQSTFLFHDYTSFIAFYGAVLPERFDVIRSISIYQALYSFPEHLRGDTVSGLATYDALYTHGLQLGNQVLGNIPPKSEKSLENLKRLQIRNILRQMPSL
ncbi:hypothetical protein K458DRAFT_396353 [Lentithecium fluviatile CBS 122367]|uniref:Uncharacterized protein n=1 Tax=Lentithecium fluviatile CBS 122367 TaxID=1168545 RepID=A0A6G1IFU6_9PLEO|nr:hypothetical protein K458DRAFT_396353 [Lentithecium fluviatile CBS 122367]